MRRHSPTLLLLAGVGLGLLAGLFQSGGDRTARAGSSDRYDNYVMCTGAVSVSPRLQTDGVWLLDYKSGKLLGTVIDKSQGRIFGWAEVDLMHEFDMPAKSDVHFMMVTGYITQGQAALYVAETTTGKFGVYTMGPGSGTGDSISIRRHDMTSFRNVMPTGMKPAAATTNPTPVPPLIENGAPLAPGAGGGVTPVGPIPGLGQVPNPPTGGRAVTPPKLVGPIPGLGQPPATVPTPTPMQPAPPSINTPDPNGPPLVPPGLPGGGPPPIVVPPAK